MIVLGHRGGRGDGWPPENSLEAFARALGEGADGVELDVRATASGDPVIVHDPTLARITDGRDARPIHAVETADLPRLDGQAKIPSLLEALDVLRGRIVNIEIKPDLPRPMALVRTVLRALERFSTRGANGSGATEVVVSSFDPRIVLAVSVARGGRIPLGMLVGPRTPRLGTALPLALRRFVVAAHLEDGLITARRVDRLVRAGLRVVGWTVNDRARAAEIGRFGVGWTITDRPGEIVRAVRPDSPNGAS